MQLSPREKDKLLIAMAAEVARKRKSRGVKLNYPEAIALICDAVVEGARDGKSVAEMMEFGATIVKSTDCMDGIPEMIPEVQVEAKFQDGTNLDTDHNPIRKEKDVQSRTFSEPCSVNLDYPAYKYVPVSYTNLPLATILLV